MPEDLEHFLEPEKAQQAFDVLDVDGDGQVTLHNIRDAVVNIYQVLGCWDCLHVHTLIGIRQSVLTLCESMDQCGLYV